MFQKRILFGLMAAVSIAGLSPGVHAQTSERPNIVVIMVDDLGFSDLGAFGGEIRTPNLDALANSGVRFTGFHTAPMCSPSRAMLLTGSDPHRVGLGAMSEMTTDAQKGKPGYEGYLKPSTATIAELLSASGYQTMLSGKWHLGIAPEQDPSARGFKQSFALLQAGHNHFGLGTTIDPRKGATYTQDGVAVAALPADFYSSDYFTTKMVEFIGKASIGEARAKPIFAYLSFTAPHSPLQAPAADIARYRGAYNGGFEVLRKQRLNRQAKLGLYDPSRDAHRQERPEGGWAALPGEQREIASRNMEVYAAMVDRVDQNVGRVVAELKRTGRFEDTVVIFLSDNGAEGLDTGNTEVSQMRRRAEMSDNSLANRGAATSYFSYGPGWASAATAPSRLYKSYATEGGSRTVAFLSGPARITGRARIASAYISAADIVPTFLELAGVKDPQGQFENRAVEPILGKSIAPYLRGQASQVHSADEAIGTEIFGSRSIRKGDWKITDLGDGTWQLFNIARDPGETKDLSARHPDRLDDLRAEWDAYAKRMGLILPGKRPYTP